MIMDLERCITYDYHRRLSRGCLDHSHEQQGVSTRFKSFMENVRQYLTYIGKVDFQGTTPGIDICLQRRKSEMSKTRNSKTYTIELILNSSSSFSRVEFDENLNTTFT